jgi:hypothetical protein
MIFCSMDYFIRLNLCSHKVVSNNKRLKNGNNRAIEEIIESKTAEKIGKMMQENI